MIYEINEQKILKDFFVRKVWIWVILSWDHIEEYAIEIQSLCNLCLVCEFSVG